MLRRKLKSATAKIHLCLIFVMGATATRFDIVKDVRFKMNYRLLNESQGGKWGKSYFSAEGNLTRTKGNWKNSSQVANFVPDLTTVETLAILNSSKEFEWGINCLGKDVNLCILGDVEDKGSYAGVEYEYYDGHTVMDISREFFFEGARADFPVRFISNITKPEEKWLFNKTGVLGLAKGSDFLGYVMDQYVIENNELMFSFNLGVNPEMEADKYQGSMEGTFDKSYLSINGFTNSALYKEKVTPWLPSSDGKFWNIDNMTITFKQDSAEELNIIDGPSCLLLNSPDMLLLPSDMIPKFKKSVMRKICENDVCNQAADIERGPKLLFMFKDSSGKEQNFEIKPEKYIYSIKGEPGLRVAVGSLEDVADGLCPLSTKFGLGRMFFLSKYLIFKTIKDNGDFTYEIGVGDKIDTDDLSKIWIVYAISLGTLGLMVFIFILKTICLWKKKLDVFENDMTASSKESYKKV